jgi:phosphoglycolate phosphatase
MTVPTLVFDLDGTLVDTAPDLIAACHHVLAGIGLPPAPDAIVRPRISFGSRAMIVAALAHHGVSLGDADIDRLWHGFLARYAETLAVSSRPFEGVVAVVERHFDAGTRLAVCTNKIERHSRTLLEALGLAQHFHAIAGRDTFTVMKPDPGHLLQAIDAAGGSRHRAVMIGDSDVDIATAKAAGIPVIAVTFGYTPHPVATYGPNATIDHYREFESALERVRAHN